MTSSVTATRAAATNSWWDNVRIRTKLMILVGSLLGLLVMTTGLAVSRLSNDLEVVRAFKQLTHPRADDVMVISQQNANFGF